MVGSRSGRRASESNDRSPHPHRSCRCTRLLGPRFSGFGCETGDFTPIDDSMRWERRTSLLAVWAEVEARQERHRREFVNLVLKEFLGAVRLSDVGESMP